MKKKLWTTKPKTFEDGLPWQEARVDTHVNPAARGEWVCIPPGQMVTYTTNVTIRGIIERLESSLGLSAWITGAMFVLVLAFRCAPKSVMAFDEAVERFFEPLAGLISNLLNMPVQHSLPNAGYMVTFLIFLVPLGLVSWAVFQGATRWSPTHLGLTPGALWILVYTEPSTESSSYSSTKQKRHCVYEKVPWKTIERVYMLSPSGAASARRATMRLQLNNGKNFDIKMDLLVNADDWPKLTAAFREFMPAEKVDRAVFTTLEENEKPRSFTELWLHELTTPPNRKQLRPLASGMILKGGRYRITGQLGMGGQATVYLAVNQSLKSDDINKEVAVKEFVLPLTSETTVREKASRDFNELAALLSKLSHPGIAHFIDAFVEDHRAYLVIERANGQSLAESIRLNGPKSESEVIELGIQLADILSYLHSESVGLVHQDFNPDNLVVDDGGRIKLIDLSPPETTADGSPAVTGKQAYMAPEQVKGKPEKASDIYALGATLSYMLTGQEPVPISESNPQDINPAVTSEMNSIVRRATAFDTRERYANVLDLKADLESLNGATISLNAAEKEKLRERA